MIFSTQALVLNKKNFGDTSVICNLFSVDHGKFAIIAKGARSIKNPMGAILQPLNQIECIYYYKSGRNIQILKVFFYLSMKREHYGLVKNCLWCFYDKN